ncbi:uncharacterized protein P884DRAFT_263461 [Thermothelomyces heterothallicus CBS 202.75]|uniref:uncharacterized protein n=1 Tax=Thermothelomyces heterothallicus CBS 202.75 TaxID=1149848 RepID=UPI0037440AA9
MALRTNAQLLLAHARTLRQAASGMPTVGRSLNRRYHPSGSLLSYKDDQDRRSLKPRPSEGTKSGSDDQVAEKTEAAFNPNMTSPEEAKESAAKHSNGNPLEASGANQEFSKPRAPEEAADKSDKKTKSGGTVGKKHGKVAPM